MMDNSFTFTVSASYLAVLKLFAGKKDVRYYLNGINVEISQFDTKLIATDGKRLGVFRLGHADPASIESMITNAIIPIALLDKIEPMGDVVITLGTEETGSVVRSVQIQQGEFSFIGKTVDRKYPDWRKVIPRTVSNKVAQFDPNYIGDLGKAARILSAGKGKYAYTSVLIGHNGLKDGALIQFSGQENFIGVVMPIIDVASVALPEWALDLCEGSGEH